MNIRIIKAKPPEQQLWDKQMAPRLTGDKAKDRLMIQRWISINNFRPTVLHNGNCIIRKDKIIAEFKRILKRGTLTPMSNYFYEFLHLNAGSIAHYNKQGWIEEYGNCAQQLCDFFLRNEYGVDIVHNQPGWKTDCIEIGKEILSIIETHRSQQAA